VRIKKLNLPEENKASVYARMTEERNRIAKKFRAEGVEKSMIIRAEAEKEKVMLLSRAQQKADEILGRAEAEATGIYAKAHGKNPEFFSFVRTLEAYEKFMDEKTTVVLSRDSELLKLFSKGK
jgi:membrane protease subunit HflC